MQSSSTSTTFLQPLIIAVGDTNHYLVGVVDSNNNFSGLKQKSVQVVATIVEAKAYLRRNDIFSAMLELNCAYDEMCGLPNSARYRQRILC